LLTARQLVRIGIDLISETDPRQNAHCQLARRRRRQAFDHSRRQRDIFFYRKVGK
jgi:hypothetical protein